MIPGIIKKGLVELGKLEPDILDIGRNGNEEGFIGKYDGDEFYFILNKGCLILEMKRDNPILVMGFEKLMNYRHYKRISNKEKVIYEWNPEVYKDRYGGVF